VSESKDFGTIFPGDPKYASICNTNYDTIFNTFPIVGEPIT